MAAFDPATIQLQRDLLDKTTSDLARDERLLDKQPEGSKSKMATRLRERIATGKRVAFDLRGLITFMEGLNAEQDAEAARDGQPTAAPLLSSTPLAVAFGATPAAEDGA